MSSWSGWSGLYAIHATTEARSHLCTRTRSYCTYGFSTAACLGGIIHLRVGDATRGHSLVDKVGVLLTLVRGRGRGRGRGPLHLQAATLHLQAATLSSPGAAQAAQPRAGATEQRLAAAPHLHARRVTAPSREAPQLATPWLPSLAPQCLPGGALHTLEAAVAAVPLTAQWEVASRPGYLSRRFCAC